ncbi:MAG: VPLPA-CTERM-specific exosortase XrtD [Alphaproteobacteria bacterium]|nr:VPLPA-CTERM-specific exosortase XrtD [Alphaproteobacteria bacterium]
MTVAERMTFNMTSNDGKAMIAALLATMGVGAVLYWDAIGNLFFRWGAQDELSHSYFIPLVSAWLIWENRQAVKASVGAPSFAGVAIAAVGLAFLLTGRLSSIYLIQQLGLVITIASVVAAFGGVSLLRCLAAPIAFLFFAVPPPFWVITVLSWNFQEWSSILGVAMIEAMNIPVFLQGNIIDLGDYKLQVAEACSGLRYLFPFLSIGVMAGYIYRGPMWHRIAIAAATVPITILMNSFRIAVTGALVQAYGTQHAEGALHFFEGWVVFALCLVELFAVVAILARLKTPRDTAFNSLATPDLPTVTPSSRTSQPVPAALAMAAVFAAALGLSQVIKIDALTIPDRTPFAALPAEFGDAVTMVRPIDPEVAETLGADDAIVVDVARPEESAFNLYIAYLEAQRDGRSWHSPRQCIPGGGWQITDRSVQEGLAPDGSKYHYNRMIIENRGVRQLVYYYYDQRGRKIANEFVMKFWLIHDAVIRNRSDGAMVRLMTIVNEDESIEDAEKFLSRTLLDVQGILPAYVPH